MSYSRRAKILVFSTDVDSILYIDNTLKERGYDVSLSSSIKEFVNELCSDKYDLLVIREYGKDGKKKKRVTKAPESADSYSSFGVMHQFHDKLMETQTICIVDSQKSGIISCLRNLFDDVILTGDKFKYEKELIEKVEKKLHERKAS